jgi:hypothetical protein
VPASCPSSSASASPSFVWLLTAASAASHGWRCAQAGGALRPGGIHAGQRAQITTLHRSETE